jgi:pyridoxamine 5'-phosphate oxidase
VPNVSSEDDLRKDGDDKVERLTGPPHRPAYPFSTYSTSDNAPKVRYVVHRSLTPLSNLLLTSTDHRMKKYKELEENPNVELAFWMEKTGVQFRISGKAAVLPNKPEEKSALEKILKETLHAKGSEATPEYWTQKRDEEFEKMSGHLRATFARPPPGTPLEDLKEGEKPGDWSESIKPPGEDVSRIDTSSFFMSIFRFRYRLSTRHAAKTQLTNLSPKSPLQNRRKRPNPT